MSIFGLYFVKGMLLESGWPRKQGILRKNVVDTTILDSVISEMVNWSSAIGAGHPELGLQVLAEIFRNRDWNSENAPDVRLFINAIKLENNAWNGDIVKAPEEVVSPNKFSQLGNTISAGILSDGEFRTSLEQFFLEGLLWGLENRETFVRWYNSHIESASRNQSILKESGLKIDKPDDLSSHYDHSKMILQNYQNDISKLPQIPDRLLSDAKELGWAN